MKIQEMLDVDLLNQYIQDGLITVRHHPRLPLCIYNYSKICQYRQQWDDVTKRCRGLIVDEGSNVIGAGFHKFFNYGEPQTSNIDTSGPVQVTDKVDGSLGIVCFYKDELVVATRGSFESEQAHFAYDLISSNYNMQFKLLCDSDTTALVEIIYPENRIVVDYRGMRDVVLIGAQSTFEAYGRHLWKPASEIYSWPGPKVEAFNVNSFEEALALPPRENAEGIVVYFENSGDRLKVKQEDYIALHKLISNLTPKNIWQQLRNGNTLEAVVSSVPDEFYSYVNNIGSNLLMQHSAIVAEIMHTFNNLLNKLPTDYKRRDFAFAVAQEKYKSQLFAVLDNRHDMLLDSVWKLVQPKED